jgi:hypothetical protein
MVEPGHPLPIQPAGPEPMLPWPSSGRTWGSDGGGR